MRFVSAILLPIALAGCGETRPWAFVEAGDVVLELPGASASADAPIRTTVEDSAADIDRAVVSPLLALEEVVEFVRSRRETDRRGDWRVFGPFDDPSGRELTWRVEFLGDGDGTDFTVDVGLGRGSSPTTRVAEGSVAVDGDLRQGEFTLDVGEFSSLPGVKGDLRETFRGTADISFDRDLDSGKRSLTMDLEGFSSARLGEPGWTSSCMVEYTRDQLGAGLYAIELDRDEDQPLVDGATLRRFALSMQWRPDARRHARASATGEQPEDAAPEDAAPELGDLVVDECFGVDGELVYADVSEPYRETLPQYVRGDRSQCAFSDAELERQ